MPADAAAEEQFGPYLVYERLGVGGMATVHRALERAAGGVEGFERTVALKRLLPHLAEDATFIKSFVREAKLASYLAHVNIAQTFELGRVGSEYFISMEYIDGRDIRRILRHARKATGPPPLHVTVGLLTQLCDALDYAHNKTDETGHPLGLVHRDVSPSNLLVTTQGHLKVIDFGIAKAQSSALRTQTGRVKGKLAYMAPEAISGRELDARSDLFSAGVIAHELLTARPLFASKNEYQTLLKVQRGDILPPSTFNQACRPEMDAIVMKALARDPDDRYASAAAMREDLVELRRSAGLATGTRDIATWIAWAFTLEPDAGFSGATAVTAGAAMQITPPRSITPRAVPVRAATPRPEDDDAVEIAWGGGNEENGDGGPVLLDDIPDVSSKHLAAPGLADLALDRDAHVDDIPAAEPSHGVEPRRPESSRVMPMPRRLSHAEPGQTGRFAARREPLPDDTLPGDHPAGLDDDAGAALAQVPYKSPTERMPSIADQAIMPEDLVRASEPLLDPLAIPPLVAARRPSAPPAVAPRLSNQQPDLSRIARTRPGHQPARRYPTAESHEPTAAARATSEVEAPRRPSTVIGAAIIERQNVRGRFWLPVSLAALLLGGGAAVLYAYVLRDDVPPTPAADLHAGRGPGVAVPPLAEPGTVKFVMEPADADIRIDGKEAHAGSPWTTELAAGAYPIEIHRTGYKSWLTTLELSARETQTMRVVLEPLGAQHAAQTTATLVLSTTPPGLEAVLDGNALAQPTPIKIAIHPGLHVVALRRGGVEVWRQEVAAQADATYEYAPSFTLEKERERLERPRPFAPRPALPLEPQRPALPSPQPVAEPPPLVPPQPPPLAQPAPAPSPPPPTPVVTPLPAPVVPAPPAHGGPPPVIAPNAVTRIGGDPVSFTAFRGTEMPAIVSAKLCIDQSGHVTSADVMTKIERRAAQDIAAALQTWTYAPYRHAGAASPACFVVAMRTR